MRSMAEIYGEMVTIVEELDRLGNDPPEDFMSRGMLKGRGLRLWPGPAEEEVMEKLSELSKEYFDAYTLEKDGYLEMNPSIWESDKFKLQMLLNNIEIKNNRQTPIKGFDRSSRESMFYYMLMYSF